MKSYEFEAVTYKGEVYCIECLPEDVLPTDPECFPIFGNAEWDYAPSCTVCGAVHDYMIIVKMEDNNHQHRRNETIT